LTDFSERRILSAKNLEGASPDVPKIFGSAGALPSRKLIHQSLIANRQSLSFWLGGSLAFPFLPHRLKSVATKTKPAKAG
jgi:hypothetical protein